MERLVRTGLLYDFYGGLLTDKQRRVMELYFLENWSLAEIADTLGVSRQAIHDLLQRSEKIIEGLEKKLGLLARYDKQQTGLATISDRIQTVLEKLPERNIPLYQELIEIKAQVLRLLESETEA